MAKKISSKATLSSSNSIKCSLIPKVIYIPSAFLSLSELLDAEVRDHDTEKVTEVGVYEFKRFAKISVQPMEIK